MIDLAPWCFVAVGLGLVAYSGVMAARARRSESWPPVTAVITRSDVVRERGNRNTTYRAAIEFRYDLGGQQYHADTICSGGTLDTSMRGRAERRCAKYPVGASVVAFYDSANPSRACLERTAEGTWIIAGIGAAIAAVGSLHLMGVIRIGD